MAEWWEVARRLVVMTQVASVTKRLRHRFANTGSVAERGHAGWPGPPPGSKTDLLSWRPLGTESCRQCTEGWTADSRQLQRQRPERDPQPAWWKLRLLKTTSNPTSPGPGTHTVLLVCPGHEVICHGQGNGGPGCWVTALSSIACPNGACVVNDLLLKQQVTRMDWPALSPDLNSKERLWDVLGRQMGANHTPPYDPTRCSRFHSGSGNRSPSRLLGSWSY